MSIFIKRKTTKQLMLEGINAAKPVGTKINNHYVPASFANIPFSYDLILNDKEIPYIPGMYVFFSTKKSSYQLLEAKNYPLPRKYSQISSILKEQYKKQIIDCDAPKSFMVNGIAYKIVLIVDRKQTTDTHIAEIESCMSNVGYHIGVIQKLTTSLLFIQFETYYTAQLEQKQIPKYLYHATTIDNANSIKNVGFIASNDKKNHSFQYPPRNYFFLNYNKLQFINFLYESNRIPKENKGVNSAAVIIIDPLKTHADYYTDVNMQGAVYTYDDITEADAITDIEYYNNI